MGPRLWWLASFSCLPEYLVQYKQFSLTPWHFIKSASRLAFELHARVVKKSYPAGSWVTRVEQKAMSFDFSCSHYLVTEVEVKQYIVSSLSNHVTRVKRKAILFSSFYGTLSEWNRRKDIFLSGRGIFPNAERQMHCLITVYLWDKLRIKSGSEPRSEPGFEPGIEAGSELVSTCL